jgi:hypothetical protein
MLPSVVSALMVVAGGACAIAGYMVGAWRQRLAMEMDFGGDDAPESFMDVLDVIRAEKARDNRPN